MCKRCSRDDIDYLCWKCGNLNVIRKVVINYDVVVGMWGREVFDIVIVGEDLSVEEDDMDG